MERTFPCGFLGFHAVELSSPQEHDLKEGKMRHLSRVILIAIVAGLIPSMARADNDNQTAAVQIRDHIRNSGQMSSDYKVAVRYLDGTVWLQGHVHDPDQLNKAVALVFSTPEITINQVIKDDLKVDGTQTTASPSNATASTTASQSAGDNPLRSASDGEANQVQRVPSSFNGMRRATPVAMMQPVPPAPVAAPAGGRPSPLPRTEVSAGVPGAPLPMYPAGGGGGVAPVRYDQPAMPGYAWPSYASYPNYAAVTYPKQYSPTAWPYIGPFYPYPQVPLGWRKVSLEWDDGWWWLDFKDKPRCCWWR